VSIQFLRFSEYIGTRKYFLLRMKWGNYLMMARHTQKITKNPTNSIAKNKLLIHRIVNFLEI